MKNSDSPFRVGILIYQCRCVYPYLNDECKVRDYFRNWQISYGKNVFYLLFFTNTLPEANHSVSHWRQVSRLKGNYRASPDIDLAVVGKDIDYNLLLTLQCEIDDLEMLYSIDLLDYQKQKGTPIGDHIDRVGQVFYEAA